MNVKKKNIVIIAIVVLLLSFFTYKGIMLSKYECEKREIDTSLIFNETLTIDSKEEYTSERINVDNMSFLL